MKKWAVGDKVRLHDPYNPNVPDEVGEVEYVYENDEMFNLEGMYIVRVDQKWPGPDETDQVDDGLREVEDEFMFPITEEV